MALAFASDYIVYARELLQDTKDTPYRYSDNSLYRNLEVGFQEMRKLRPDLLLNTDTPDVIANGVPNPTLAIPVDEMYRMALVYYVVGVAQLRDDEEVTDQRAAAFLGLFQTKLTTLA